MEHTIETTEILEFLLKDDGIYPNNAHLQVFLYKHALELPEVGEEQFIEDTFRKNNWMHAWSDGVYNFHHYHSTAHEVLAIFKGSARILLGGGKGTVIKVERGDVVIIPAGVAHKNLDANMNFKCVGAYPKGQDPDMNYGLRSERPTTDKQIEKVPLPEFDPVFGKESPMLKSWHM
jgi:uncharacterized protein YjlB